jgi:hypothetical protein
MTVLTTAQSLLFAILHRSFDTDITLKLNVANKYCTETFPFSFRGYSLWLLLIQTS